jgi:hypothetical protein
MKLMRRQNNMNDIEKLIEYIKDHSNNYLGSKTTLKEIETFEYMYDLLIGTLEKQLSGGWIPFETEYDEDLKMDMLQCEIPEDEEEILVTDGKSVWSDTFMRDGMECYLDSGNDLIITVIAWQPLPEPFREVEQ